MGIDRLIHCTTGFGGSHVTMAVVLKRSNIMWQRVAYFLLLLS